MRRDIFQAIADPTRRAILVLIASQAMTPNALADKVKHDHLQALVCGRWVALDATMDRPIGWEPPALWKRICKV